MKKRKLKLNSTWTSKQPVVLVQNLVVNGHIEDWQKSLMAKWLKQASQWHEVYCHDLKVMNLNPSQVEVGVRSTSVLSRTLTKNNKNINLSMI